LPRPPEADEPKELPPDWASTGLNKYKQVPRMVREQAAIAAQIRALEEKNKELKTKIELALVESGVDKTSVDGRYRIQIIKTAGAPRIVKEKLLELGVPQKVIDKATVQNPSAYIRIDDTERA
jgi:hypothetical protein